MPVAELGQERIVDQLDRGRFEALHIGGAVIRCDRAQELRRQPPYNQTVSCMCAKSGT
jgi:hypothetical protein